MPHFLLDLEFMIHDSINGFLWTQVFDLTFSSDSIEKEGL